MNKQIIFIIPDQFGYSAGYYYYAQYLINLGCKVIFFSVDRNLSHVTIPSGVKVIYLENQSEAGIPFIYSFIKNASLFLRKQSRSYVIIKQIPFSFLIKLIGGKHDYILDIRTGAITNNILKESIINLLIKVDTFFFKKYFILSEKLRNKLLLSKKKSVILPLGAYCFSKKIKNYSQSFRLLYVGTLNHRRINDTVMGFAKAKKIIDIPIEYHIVGYGANDEEDLLRFTIKKENLDNFVFFHGRKKYEELSPYFDKCNIGICYVPKTDYYMTQPPTKIYEYALSGLITLGTSTIAISDILTKDSGIIHDDNSTAFANALVNLYNDRKFFSEQKIRKIFSNNDWEKIVNSILFPTIKML